MSEFKLNAAEFQALYKRLRSGPSWGSTDHRGALNNISAAPVALKAATDNPDPAVHEMTQPEAGADGAPGSRSPWTGSP